MTDETGNSGSDAEREREIRQRRKFSPQEALGRIAGPGAMKGASPVSPQQQADIAVGSWLRDHMTDPTGSLQTVLHRHLKGSQLLIENVENPLLAVEGYCRRVLGSEERLKELVRETDVEWGRAMDERPYFEREGAAMHPDDPYTVDSVRETLARILTELGS